MTVNRAINKDVMKRLNTNIFHDGVEAQMCFTTTIPILDVLGQDQG